MPEQDIFQNEVEVAADIPQNVEVKQYTSSITIGDVTTLPAGSNATVENVGTEEQAILNFGLPKGDAGSMWGELAGDIADQEDLNTILTGLRTDVDAKAPKASPAFTGTPTAPTAVDDTNTTQIATTAFVKNAITNLQNYLQSYINTAVANVLKIMDFSNATMITLTPGNTYTCPSNGYIIVTSFSAGSAAVRINDKNVFTGYKANNSSDITTGYSFSVLSGDIVSNVSPAVNVGLTFVPFKS